MRDEDRHLKPRGKRGTYQYIRRVPSDVAHIDKRELVQLSLKTSDLYLARKRRDAQEATDDKLWHAMRLGHDDSDIERYKAASELAVSLQLEYIVAEQVAKQNLDEIYHRTKLAVDSGMNKAVVNAALGGVKAPIVNVSKAFEIYIQEIAVAEKNTKSPNQYRKWLNRQNSACQFFIDEIGDVEFTSITRFQAQKFYKFWKTRLELEKLSPSYANRIIGTVRKVYREYHKYLGDEDKINPFRNLNFKDRWKDKKRGKWPPFSVSWITNRFLVPDALGELNRQAALIFYGLIETGLRPSEAANLKRHNNKYDAKIPHIIIQPEDDRDIKTDCSERVIPLVGVSLQAFSLAPDGFARYFDKEDNLSKILMKTMRTHWLLETEKHAVYSLRHSFEDRMTEAGLDYELRCELMGHDIDRADYGEGGSLEWKRDQLAKIALPFPPDLLKRYAETD